MSSLKRISRARKGVFAAGAAAALLAFPGVASAAVNSSVVGGVLTVTSTADDAITITCETNQIKVNGANPTGNGACDALTSIVVNGGPGANAINLTGVVATVFPALTSVTIDGGEGNDTITGSDRADVIDGGGGNDRIIGDNNPDGTFDDSRGGAGDDTIVWNPGDGSDLNDGGAGIDTIEVNGGGGAEKFSANPAAAGGGVRFERSADSAGGFFSLDITTSERLDMNANGGDDSFTSEGAIAALGFALDVDGGANNDTLDGSDGADLIDGGDGNDRIIGDNNPLGTRDNSRGGAGDDTMVWNPGDGDDINEGGAGSDTVEVNGGNGAEQFTVAPSAAPGRISFDRSAASAGGAFNLDIGTSERLDMNANGGDDTFTADGALAALGFALDVDGGANHDTLDGSDGADLIDGGDGNDRITGDDNPAGTRDNSRGGAGDDTMVWNPGDDDDINEGGDGIDVSEVNGGGDEEFTVKPSAVAGRVSFDRSAASAGGAFNVDIGTTENLRLNAGAGNDKIRGSKGLAGLIVSTLNGDDGNDRIKGTDGEDALGGGNGHDVINARDKSADAVECGSGFDFALVDDRDTVRGCDLVLGGRLRVALAGKAALGGNAVALRLRCVATERCKGKAVLRHAGRKLGAKKFKLAGGNSKQIRVQLNKHGRRYVAANGKRVKLRITAHDKQGNGWRTATATKLKR